MSHLEASQGRVLVVDDEAPLVAALCATLTAKGYRAAGCETAAAAREALATGDWDCLLVDLRMPGMDGIALLRAALEMDPRLVGIVMTGHGSVESAVEAMQVGAFDYVLKPVALPELLPRLRRAMELRRLRLENIHLQELTSVYELSMAAALTLDPAVILEKVTEASVRGTGADELSVVLLSEDERELYVAAVEGNDRRGLVGYRFPADQGVVGYVARNREPVTLTGEVRDARFAPLHPRPEIRSAVSVPMLAGGKVVGALNANAIRRRPFTRGETKVLSILANLAASALQSARLLEAVKREAQRLEGRVLDRTRELERLNSQLAEASRRKSEFLANMSHELRTPLNSIIGFSSILQDGTAGPLGEKQTRFLGHIAKAGQHLLQLINDLLDLSKVEAGRLTLRVERLAVGPVVEEALGLIRGLVQARGQTVEVAVDPDLPPLQADALRFKQILFNLLSNAVKFTPEGGTVRVTARRIADRGCPDPAAQSAITDLESAIPGDWLELSVTDTGVGIRPEDLPRLFQEFVQLREGPGHRHEGTGLGLVLTKRIVELHGGRIRAASPGEGQGSTFTVHLPLQGPSE